jgi:SAM-dependent methyltransferase
MSGSAWREHAGILRCPVTGETLTLLSAEEVAKANRDIVAGRLCHPQDQARPLTSEALGTPDRATIYRIEDDIACILPQLALTTYPDEAAPLDVNSAGVQRFYDEYGWLKNQSGKYNDTADFTDTRAVSVYYAKQCNRRVSSQLRSGRYLLDAASGAIPHPDYVEFSQGYDFRVCLDFSLTALREAKAKLGAKGLYILGDLTRLPLASDAIDDVISLHTVYHIPENQLATAVDELVRIVRPHGRVIIVSVWASSPLMDVAMAARRILGTVKRSWPGTRARSPAPAPQGCGLYYAPFGYRRYLNEIAARHPTHLRLWCSTSAAFQKAFFAENWVGLACARLDLTAETLFEPLFARYGQYPMFVVRKDAGQGEAAR